jgi:hypothetical protein
VNTASLTFKFRKLLMAVKRGQKDGAIQETGNMEA